MTDSEQLLPALFNTTTLSNEQALVRRQLVEAAQPIIYNPDVPFATDLDPASAEVLAIGLAATKDKGDAQLSYALYVLRENKAYLTAGYDSFQEYVEARIKISAPRASALATRWESFLTVGLAANVLSGNNPVSWSKFGELVPGIKAGIVDHGNIDVWLPIVATEGEFSLTNAGISKLIKAEIAGAAAEETPDQMETFSVRVTADEKAHMLRFIQTIEEATGILGAGDIIVTSLEAKVTEIATDSEDVRKNYGLARFKDIAEKMAPGIQVVFLADAGSGYTEATLGVVPVTKLYSTAPITGQVMLAASIEEAKAVLGETVYETLISVSNEEETDNTVSDIVYEEVEEEMTLSDITNTNKVIAKELVSRGLLSKEDIARIRKNSEEVGVSTKERAKATLTQLTVLARENNVPV